MYIYAMRATFFLLIVLFLTTGCFQYTKSVYRSSSSRKEYLVVKTFVNSQCGCTDIYAEQYVHGKLVYVFSYGCTFFLPARKILYDYDANGKQIAEQQFSLVDTGSSIIAFDARDLLVIQKIGSFTAGYHPQLPEYALCKRNYKGYIKSK